MGGGQAFKLIKGIDVHVELFSISIRGFYAFFLNISCKRKNVERDNNFR